MKFWHIALKMLYQGVVQYHDSSWLVSVIVRLHGAEKNREKGGVRRIEKGIYLVHKGFFIHTHLGGGWGRGWNECLVLLLRELMYAKGLLAL